MPIDTTGENQPSDARWTVTLPSHRAAVPIPQAKSGVRATMVGSSPPTTSGARQEDGEAHRLRRWNGDPPGPAPPSPGTTALRKVAVGKC